jgi:hypothetical protein
MLVWPSLIQLRPPSQELEAHACNPSYVGGWD